MRELQEDGEASSVCSSSADSLSDEPFDDESTASQDTVEPQNGQNPLLLDGWGIIAISRAGYHLGRVVGSDSPESVIVRHAAQQSDFRPYAVKACSSCGQSGFAAQFEGLRSEYELLRTLVHPSIVSVAFLFYSKHDIWLFREWCTDGSLWAYVLEHGELEESHAWRLADQMVEGIHYVHGKGLVHQNLQPSNLLLTKHAQMLKIVGFSKSATTCDDGTLLQSVKKSMRSAANMQQPLHELAHASKAWMAPEQVFGYQVTQLVDVWSCGLCVAFMLLRRHPFSSKALNSCDDLNGHALRRAVKSMCRGGKLPEAQLKGLSIGAKSFLEVCLQPKPTARACSQVLRLHPMLVPNISQHPLKTGTDSLEIILEHFQIRAPRSVGNRRRVSLDKLSSESTEATECKIATAGSLPPLQPEGEEEEEEEAETIVRSSGRSKTWHPPASLLDPKCPKA